MRKRERERWSQSHIYTHRKTRKSRNGIQLSKRNLSYFAFFFGTDNIKIRMTTKKKRERSLLSFTQDEQTIIEGKHQVEIRFFLYMCVYLLADLDF
jgi:hypothetical protein